jgi:uncharacterized membrane protein YcaP (DUF421 family)
MHSVILSNMFHLGLPVFEKILRPIVVYSFIVVGFRLAGKRELAQLNPFDLIVLLTISNTVQNAIIGDDNSVTGGLIGASTLLLINYLFVRFLYSHRKVDELLEGNPDVLINKGRVVTGILKKDLITKQELEAAAHRQGFGSLKEVERAMLEPGGTISFVGKTPAPEESRHRELLDKLNQLSRELAALRQGPQPG